MQKSILLLSMVIISCLSAAQRKMPNLSFQEHSLEFADANRSFDENDQFLDTLADASIIQSLTSILTENPSLYIDLIGHVALNEDTTIALQRAEKVKQLLIDNGIDSIRLSAKSAGHRIPIIKDEIIFGLASKEERDAGNQKNRRVEVKIAAVKQD